MFELEFDTPLILKLKDHVLHTEKAIVSGTIQLSHKSPVVNMELSEGATHIIGGGTQLVKLNKLEFNKVQIMDLVSHITWIPQDRVGTFSILLLSSKEMAAEASFAENYLLQ